MVAFGKALSPDRSSHCVCVCVFPTRQAGGSHGHGAALQLQRVEEEPQPDDAQAKEWPSVNQGPNCRLQPRPGAEQRAYVRVRLDRSPRERRQPDRPSCVLEVGPAFLLREFLSILWKMDKPFIFKIHFCPISLHKYSIFFNYVQYFFNHGQHLSFKMLKLYKQNVEIVNIKY